MAKSRSNLATEALSDILDTHENFEDDVATNEEDSIDANAFLNDDLLTHAKIKNSLVGNLTDLKKGFSKVILQTTQEMTVDDFGLIHNGFIFGSAEYAAVASINEENVVVIGCRSKFFAPAKLGDIIEFEAKGRFEEARKREIKVVGKINEIKVFEGIFQAILLENHILKTTIRDLQANFNPKDFQR